MGKSIGILSVKGGVGKTSSVIALGDAFSKFGKKVLLVDANFSAPNLGVHLNIIEPKKTAHHVLNRTASFKDAIQKMDNFDVLPSSMFEDILISPIELRKKLGMVKGKYDFVIIDSSPSLSEETIGDLIASDEVFIVTTPDYPTLSMTLKTIKLARKRGIPINGLILNKVHGRDFELSIDNIEKTAEVPVLAVIPYDTNILESVSEFTPSVTFNPYSRASNEYMKLAAILSGKKHNPFSIRRFMGITPKKQDINRDIFYESYFK